ncbi:MAG: protocatechuate 3,4-dioxygenase subunit alpha [Salinarimonas sp.]|nr:protocatechuate 3,4-dioxygenase subunit alpha [Salinarimonas sp.]
MHDPLGYLKQTPSQTAGPYLHIGCTPVGAGLDWPHADLGATMISDETRGERISITGCVHDGMEAPLRDALIEIWQADAQGIHPRRGDPRGTGDPFFTGFGRCASDPETGEFRFETIRPGRVPGPGGVMMAPHVSFWIVARGINLGLHTRMYFPHDDLSGDLVLARIEHRDRIATLIAQERAPGAYHFEIFLQGPRETVFFDI